MTIFPILLVGISAFTHALWNFIGKRQNPPAAFFLLASVGTVVIFSPVLYLFRDGLVKIPHEVWTLLIFTGFIQAVYYIFLAAAYRTGDLSQTYPFARSLPVVFVALISVLLGRGNQIHPWAFLGFGLVSLGCLFLPLPDFRTLSLKSYRQKWIIFALLASFCIAGYTLIDDQSLRILRSLEIPQFSALTWALLYAELETISLGLFLFLFLLFSKNERQILIKTGLADWRMAFGMGFIINFTYVLVLVAMAFVINVSYVSAFRQLSIPIGAALGILIGKESATLPKLVGILMVIFGLVLAALT
jgi:drug/metabolite transporter (DMT)-like permease